MENDALLACYNAYGRLVDYQYRFVLGRRSKEYLGLLDKFFPSKNLCFDYYKRSDPGSNISADWLLTGSINNEKCYLFLDQHIKQRQQDRIKGNYYIKSFFPERGIIYGKNAKQI